MEERRPIPRIPGMAIAALVCGILGLFGGFVLAILGIIFGAKARSDIRMSNGLLTGESMATAGLICGIIGIATSILWLFIFGAIGTCFHRLMYYY